MSNLLVVTLLRLDNGNWSWSTGDKNRTMEPRQGVGAQTAEQALKQALDAAGYSSVEGTAQGRSLMHYIAPAFAFNLAEIGALLCGFAGYHAQKHDSRGMGLIAYASGIFAVTFAVGSVVLAWN